MEDSLHKRYTIKLLANIVNGIFNMLIVALVPNALGPLAYGQFTYLQQFFSQLIGFFDAGTSTAFFTKLSKNILRIELLKFYFFYALSLFVLIIFFIGIVDYFNLMDLFFHDISTKYIYLASGIGFFTWFLTLFVYISDAHALTVSVESWKIFHKILSLLLLLFFIYFLKLDLLNYFYYYYASLILFIGFLIYLLIRKKIFSNKLISIKINYKTLIREFYTFSSPLVIFNIFAMGFGLFDIWSLQKIGGSEEVGFYGLAYAIAAMCFLFTSAMTPIIMREFAKSYEKKNLEEVKRLFSTYVPMLYSLAAYFGVFISFQSENLLEIFTNEKFISAYPVLIIMAFYPIHQTYGQLGGSIFYVTEQTRLVKKIGVISTLIGFILTLIFIYYLKLNAVGLAWKMVIIQIISVNVQLYFNSKYLNLSMFKYISHQVYSVLILIFMAYLSNLIVSFDNKIINFLLSGSLYTVFAIIVTILLPNIFGLKRKDIVNLKNNFMRGLQKWK